MKQNQIVKDSNAVPNYQSIYKGKLIGKIYMLEDQIGQGSFGIIYKAINIQNQLPSAIKFEIKTKEQPMMIREIKVMSEMQNEIGFARMFLYGKDEQFSYVVMTYLGRNLENLLQKCSGKFQLLCTLNIFKQILQRIESLHAKKLVHRDIKPENFVIGQRENSYVIHLIDFGLAKYFEESNGQHIPFTAKKGMIGTARYAPISAHKGFEQSRKDDLESIGYLIIYLAKGKLPWQCINAETKKQKYDIIKQMKIQLSTEKLCEDLPIQFIKYLNYVKNLQFQDLPDYQYLKELIQTMIDTNQKSNSQIIYDWEELQEYKQLNQQFNNQIQQQTIQNQMTHEQNRLKSKSIEQNDKKQNQSKNNINFQPRQQIQNEQNKQQKQIQEKQKNYSGHLLNAPAYKEDKQSLQSSPFSIETSKINNYQNYSNQSSEQYIKRVNSFQSNLMNINSIVLDEIIPNNNQSNGQNKLSSEEVQEEKKIEQPYIISNNKIYNQHDCSFQLDNNELYQPDQNLITQEVAEEDISYHQLYHINIMKTNISYKN